MAYTYEDFVTRANKAGMMDKFSKTDLDTAAKSPEYGISLLGLMQDSQNAQTPEQRLLATEATSQLRKSYGVAAQETAGSFSGQSKGMGSLEGVTEQKAFNYDYENDPVWQAYKKQYNREGDRASADALAKASAASGGVPSSYAVTAAQQAGNYYAGQLSDILPTLEQNAYSRYITDLAQKLEAEDTEYQKALNLYNLLGYATPEVAEILGMPTTDSPGTATGGGDGSGTSSGGYRNYNNGKLENWQIAAMQEYLNNATGAGLSVDGKWGDKSTAAAGGLTADEAWAQISPKISGNDDKTGEEYTDAVVLDSYDATKNYLSSIGINAGKGLSIDDLMPETAWRRHHAGYMQSGSGPIWAMYGTYQDYLNGYAYYRQTGKWVGL